MRRMTLLEERGIDRRFTRRHHRNRDTASDLDCFESTLITFCFQLGDNGMLRSSTYDTVIEMYYRTQADTWMPEMHVIGGMSATLHSPSRQMIFVMCACNLRWHNLR
jgi:hypothetical protein